MLVVLIDKILNSLPIPTTYAHCDVPCGIYDPSRAQIAAQTVVKMVRKLAEYPEEDLNNRVRAVTTKEEHARICKEELLILWTDYFKSEHLEKFPDLHNTFWEAAKLCSKAKQSIDPEVAKQLVEAVDKIADIYKQSKTQS